MTLQEQLEELYDIKVKIESSNFQKYIAKPLREKQDALKNAYDCKSLIELATIKGKKQGIEEFFDVLKQIDCDIRNIKTEIEQTEEN